MPPFGHLSAGKADPFAIPMMQEIGKMSGSIAGLIKGVRDSKKAKQQNNDINKFVELTSQGASPSEAVAMMQQDTESGFSSDNILAPMIAQAEIRSAYARPSSSQRQTISYEDSKGNTRIASVPLEAMEKFSDKVITSGGKIYHGTNRGDDGSEKSLAAWQKIYKGTLDEFDTDKTIPGMESISQRALSEMQKITGDQPVSKSTKIPTGKSDKKFDPMYADLMSGKKRREVEKKGGLWNFNDMRYGQEAYDAAVDELTTKGHTDINDFNRFWDDQIEVKKNKKLEKYQKFSPLVKKRTAGSAETSGLSAEDQQALEWANANPDDPRAKQIQQLFGSK